jgi:hypothetical protein
MAGRSAALDLAGRQRLRRQRERRSHVGQPHDADGVGEASGIERLVNQASRVANDEFGGPTATRNASSVGSVQM